ncbi:DUF6583 family protein [Pseudalkalibacillus sp. SCS-8]|uniref:DUF6583 family protein n=1 Tax=Pseudalkalibacillus nanhaiensis TaxID=3115291 RepID=UPI0032D9E717
MNQGKEETAATVEPSLRPKKSKKPIIISLAVIVLLGISATVYALFFSPSPKEAYFLAEKNTMEQTTEDFRNMFAINEDVNKKALEEPTDTSIDLSLKSISGLEAIDPSVAMFSQFFNQIKLNFSTKVDPTNNEGAVDLKVGLGSTEILRAEAYQSEEVTGLNVPLLYNKYLYMNNSDFGKVMKDIDPAYNGPEQMDNLIKLQLESLQNQEKLEEKGEEYGEFLFEQVKDENVTEEDGVKFEGESYKQLTLELSEKETKELIKAFIEKLEKDEETLDLIVDMSMGSNLSTMTMDKEDMKAEIKKGLDEAKKNLDKAEIPDGFKSVILVDSDNLIVKRDMTFKVGADNEIINMNISNHALRTDEVITDGKWEFNAYPEGGEKQEYVKVLLEMKGEKKGEDEMKRDITGTFAFAESGQVAGANLNATMTGKPEDMRTEFEISVENPVQQIPPVKGHFTRVVTDDLDNGLYAAKGEFGLEADPGLGSPISVVFDYESKTAFKDELNFPNVTEDGVNVAELNAQEKQELMSEIQTRIETMMMNGPQLPFK